MKEKIRQNEGENQTEKKENIRQEKRRKLDRMKEKIRQKEGENQTERRGKLDRKKEKIRQKKRRK